MHFDFLHAALAAFLVFLTTWVFTKTRIARRHEGDRHHWDWRLYFAIVFVLFLFNIIWPYN